MNPLFQEIGRLAARHSAEAYFVGGCVRDFLRGDPIKDLDLAVTGSTFELGRRIAREHQGHVFWLHEEEGVVRVALPGRAEGGGPLEVDLNPLRGTLEQDLRGRDLTINALAVRAADGLGEGAEILDVVGGRADLEAAVIRFVSRDAPERDPLRTLRAQRFRWKLGFTLDPGTEARLRECVPLLAGVSVERIRDELFQLLALRQPADALADCFALGMGRWLTGSTALGDRETAVAVERVRALATLLTRLPADVTALLETQPTPPRTRREVLLWGAVLQALEIDAGKSGRYLALSNDERNLVLKGIRYSATAKELAAGAPAPGRERYHLFRSASPAEPEAVLLAAADAGWTHPYTELLDEALRRHLHPEAPLLSGVEVMRILNLTPGPRIGQLLTAMEEARADGILHTPEEATEWLHTAILQRP